MRLDKLTKHEEQARRAYDAKKSSLYVEEEFEIDIRIVVHFGCRAATPAGVNGRRKGTLLDVGSHDEREDLLFVARRANVTRLKTFDGAVGSKELGDHGELVDDKRRGMDVTQEGRRRSDGLGPLPYAATVDAGNARKVDDGLGREPRDPGFETDVLVDDALDLEGGREGPLDAVFTHARSAHPSRRVGIARAALQAFEEGTAERDQFFGVF